MQLSKYTILASLNMVERAHAAACVIGTSGARQSNADLAKTCLEAARDRGDDPGHKQVAKNACHFLATKCPKLASMLEFPERKVRLFIEAINYDESNILPKLKVEEIQLLIQWYRKDVSTDAPSKCLKYNRIKMERLIQIAKQNTAAAEQSQRLQEVAAENSHSESQMLQFIFDMSSVFLRRVSHGKSSSKTQAEQQVEEQVNKSCQCLDSVYDLEDGTAEIEKCALEMAICLVDKKSFEETFLAEHPIWQKTTAGEICTHILEQTAIKHEPKTIAKAWFTLGRMCESGCPATVKQQGEYQRYSQRDCYAMCLLTGSPSDCIDTEYAECATELAASWRVQAENKNILNREIKGDDIVQILKALEVVDFCLTMTLSIGSTLCLGLSFVPKMPNVSAGALLSANEISTLIANVSAKIGSIQSKVQQADSAAHMAIVKDLESTGKSVDQILNDHKGENLKEQCKTKSELWTALGYIKIHEAFQYEKEGNQLPNGFNVGRDLTKVNTNKSYDLAGGIACFREALMKNPDNAHAMMGLSKAYSQVAIDLSANKKVWLNSVKKQFDESSIQPEDQLELSRALTGFVSA